MINSVTGELKYSTRSGISRIKGTFTVHTSGYVTVEEIAKATCTSVGVGDILPPHRVRQIDTNVDIEDDDS